MRSCHCFEDIIGQEGQWNIHIGVAIKVTFKILVALAVIVHLQVITLKLKLIHKAPPQQVQY